MTRWRWVMIAALVWNGAGWAAADGFLGLSVERDGPPGRGQIVAEVAAAGPAAAAGIRSGDRLLAIDSLPIRRPTDVGRGLEATRPGEQIRVDIERDGKPLSFMVRLTDRQAAEAPAAGFQPQRLPNPAPPIDPLLGVATIAPTERDLEQLKAPARFTRGALVLETAPHSAADRAGLVYGDLIVSLDGAAVDSPAELTRRVVQAGGGNEVLLGFVRAGEVRDVRARLVDPQVAAAMPQPPADDAVGGAEFELLERRVRHLEREVNDLRRELDRAVREIERLQRIPLPRRSD